MSNFKFSLVIPTYEYKGKGVAFLSKCLTSVFEQSYSNYEIIVADHSVDSSIQAYIESLEKPNINYFRNEKGRGNSSINMNEGILHAKGEYIKILHADDWFCNRNCLQLIHDEIRKNPNKKWGAVGFDHCVDSSIDENRIPPVSYRAPFFIEDYQSLAGCPSISFFINDKIHQNLFDENFIIINDADMHHRLQKKYGQPILIDDCCVTIRVHELQVTNFLTEQMKSDELKRYKEKHRINHG